MSNHTGPAGPDYADLLNHELPTDVREKLRLAAELTVAPLDNSESELEKSLVAGENTLDFNLTK